MSWNLPKLPGYIFEDPGKLSFKVGRVFEYKNGIPIMKNNALGIGGESIDAKGSAHVDNKHETFFNSRLLYGGIDYKYLPVFRPRFVQYDKKILFFKAHMKKTPFDDFHDYYTIRHVNIIYFLEDDSLCVMEPHITNSGLKQGKVIKRGKILKDDKGNCWHWTDLNVGMDLIIQGIAFHTISCDDYTKHFLLSQGIELGEDEELVKKSGGYEYKQRTHFVSETKDDSFRNLQRYLKYGDIILQFNAMWECDSEIRTFLLLFYPYDNTVEIKELNIDCEGNDPCPKFLRRTKVPKNWKNKTGLFSYMSEEENIMEEYYEATDLLIGTTLNILGRNFLLYDCNIETREYYKNILHIIQEDKVQIPHVQKKQKIKYPFPRNTVIMEEPPDSCATFISDPPHKNVVQYNINSNKNLRYSCEMISVHPENIGRKFVLMYNLADGTIRVDEIPIKNSGIISGRFSGPYEVYIPDSKNIRYSPDMFYIGAIIKINQHKFCITGADFFVYKYMKQFPDKFPQSVVRSIYDYHLRRGNINMTNDQMDNENIQISSVDAIEKDVCHEQNEPHCIEYTPQENRWEPEKLDYPLQGLECSQILPPSRNEDYDIKQKQPVICLTGLTDIPEIVTENQQSEIKKTEADLNIDDIQIHGRKCTTKHKKVAFADNLLVEQ